MKTRLLVIFVIIATVMLTLLSTFELAEGQERNIPEKIFTNQVTDPLSVTDVDPDTVDNNTWHILTVSGTGFTETFTVSLGSLPLVEAGFINTTTLTATLPAGIQAGVYAVTVTITGSQSAALPDALTVQNPQPFITSVTPDQGLYGQGTILTITGGNFVEKPSVFLGTALCTAVNLVDETTITATVSLNLLPGTYDLVVRNTGPGLPQDLIEDAFTLYSPEPTITAIKPFEGANDLDLQVIITGTDFVPTLDVALENIGLQEIEWLDSERVTAVVPWGMDEGRYDLEVINPGPSTPSDTLIQAYTVTQGIGQWNGGELYGGYGRQILFKPGNPNTIYALGYEVGLFRSRDAGEHWEFTAANVIGNADFVLDPHHPSWLYSALNGLNRSQDESDSWTSLFDLWPDGRAIGKSQVYVSPHTPGKLFFSSAVDPYLSNPTALGLLTSNDNGATWQVIADLEGVPVTDLDFHPADPLDLALVTDDGRVFRSTNGGDNWFQIASSPQIGDLMLITYNPYNPGEVWVAADYFVGESGVRKSTNFLSWQDVTPASNASISSIKFTATNTVYMAAAWGNGYQSKDGGLTWQPFGADTACCDFAFYPLNSQIIYAGDSTYGVQKSTDGGQTWEIRNQDFTAMFAYELDASPSFPQRVYSVFNSWNGIFRSKDGASSWTFLPLTGSWNVRVVREDPFDPQRIYVAADPGFYVSENGGLDWATFPWSYGMPYALEPDPYQPGRLLAGFRFGDNVHTHQGRLFASNDYGLTWSPILVTQAIPLSWIVDIAYHPETPGLVYLSTDGSGMYRSDNGGNTWERIDDQSQPAMQNVSFIGIATHPQPMLIVQTRGLPYRSFDGGATWEATDTAHGGDKDRLVFADENSTRLYAATWSGLFLSTDSGQTWRAAAGTLGRLHITALDISTSGSRTILYAATTGGDAGVSEQVTSDNIMPSLAVENNLVKAGIYRYVQNFRHSFLPLVQH